MNEIMMDAIIPNDHEASRIADQFNTEFGLSWIPEYVQYLATKIDLILDDNLMDHLTVYANHQHLTANV